MIVVSEILYATTTFIWLENDFTNVS